MIENYPFLGFPNYLKHTQNGSFKSGLKHPSYSNTPRNSGHYDPSIFNNNQIFKANTYTNSPNYSKTYNKNEKKETYQAPLFDLLGVNLYFDDILLICIILFLYNEKIDDYYLLLVLILLLLG